MQKVLGNQKRGLIFVVSAPAGTGKTTLTQMLVREFPCIIQSVSYTTRVPRDYEVSGVHYNFISRSEFEKKIEENEFLEYAEIYGNFYGTSKQWVEGRLKEGKHVVLVIDTQGAMKLKGKCPASFIFIAPPSLEELEERLKKRKTESPNVVKKRLEWAKHEMKEIGKYDYQIINDDLEVAYQVFRSIFISEEHKVT